MTNSQKNKCLVCGDAEIEKRGLCGACYERFRREKAKVPDDLTGEWEDTLIERGLLAPDARSRGNVFQQVRIELQQIAEQREGYGDSPNDLNQVPVGRKPKSKIKRPPGSEGKRKHG